MRSLIFCCLLAATPSLASPPSSSPAAPPSSSKSVTVLLTYEQPYSQASFKALERQLQHVMNGAGLRIDVRERTAADTHEQFSQLFLFTMKGSCNMADSLPIGALSDERGPLAMAYSSDGVILPYGEVECDRIRQSLQRLIGHENPGIYQGALGNAMGLVLAHELYHMLARSAQHTAEGITKESFSAHDMLAGGLSLPDVARLAMRESGPSH